jgi:hypothetical protein
LRYEVLRYNRYVLVKETREGARLVEREVDCDVASLLNATAIMKVADGGKTK